MMIFPQNSEHLLRIVTVLEMGRADAPRMTNPRIAWDLCRMSK